MSKVVSGTMVVALLGAGGYLWADINDVVPGFLTNSPEIPDPRPFPTVNVPRSDDVIESLATELDGSLPSADTLQGYVDDFVKNKDMLGKRVAVVISDSQTGQQLASHNADKLVVPASVQKLLTAVVALDQLDHDKQFRTRVLVKGDGDLYLAGEGDMLLSAGPGNTKTTNGYAGLADLADQVASELKLEGTDSARLYVDGSLFSGNNLGPWEDDVPPMGWAAPVSTIAIDNARKSEGEYAPRYSDPELEAAKTFAALLEDRGIEMSGAPTHKSYGEAGAAMAVADDEVVGQVLSAPVVDIISYLLKTSDNTLTEVIGHTVAIERGLPGSFGGATTAVIQGLKDLGLDTTGIKLVDCSGLGEKSVVTAKIVDEVLNLLVSPEHPELTVGATSLPIGYLSGTLSDRYELRNGRGLVRAKTGSLIGVSSLAGTVVTLDQRQLNFVVIADKAVPGGQIGTRRTIDAFIEQIAECGCSTN